MCVSALGGLVLALAMMAGTASAQAATSSATLVKCLRDSNVYTVAGGDPGYDQERQSLSLFFDHFPTAIVFPTSTAQVQAAVRCAAKSNVRVHPRCGNHGNEGEAIATGDLTLDLKNMTAITLSNDWNTATVQAGNTAGMVTGVLLGLTNSTRAFPIGQRPTVGISGFTLGGGFGAATRLQGLACDQIISMEAVDATGNILKIDNKRNTDLLWALRGGGGGNVVIVTTFTLRTMKVSNVTTFSYPPPPPLTAIHIMDFYQTWVTNLENRFGSVQVGSTTIRSGATSSMVPSIDIIGYFFGSVEECKQAFVNSGLTDATPINISQMSYKNVNYITAIVNGIGWDVPAQFGTNYIAAIQDRYDWPAQSFYKYKSFLLDAPVPNITVAMLLKFVEGGGIFEFQALGGVVHNVPENASAAGHLRTVNQVLVMKANSASSKATALRLLHEATNLLTAFTNGSIPGMPTYKAYVNFLDTDVPGFASWKGAYYGDTLPTLRCVKAKYDPRSMFETPIAYGSIGPQGLGSIPCTKLLKQAALATNQHFQKAF